MTVRDLAKAIVRAAAIVMVSPALVSYWIRSKLMGPDRALESSTQTLALVPGLLGQYLRRAFLGRVLAGCHSSATVEFGTIFSQTGARIDASAYVGPRCHLGLVHIGRGALLGPGVHVPSGGRTHLATDDETPMHNQPICRTLVRIGAGAWIGSAAVVMADVGCGTIVGAGAVVTRPLPDRVVAAGVPARELRSRDPVVPRLP